MRLLQRSLVLLGNRHCHRLQHQQAASATDPVDQPPARSAAFTSNFADIAQLAAHRKTTADLPLIERTLAQLAALATGTDSATQRQLLQHQLDAQLRLLPNRTHPAVRDLADSEEPRVLGHFGGGASGGDGAHHHHSAQLADGSAARPFSELCKRLNILRTEHLGHFTGPKSYYLLADLADLEQALVRHTVAELRRRDFRMISVPDILPPAVIEGCGMRTEGARNQVYKVETAGGEVQCLSGTAEMALAGYFAGREWPVGRGRRAIRVMAASRCFRAETSGLQEEKGIYRVHTFSKVEMFAVCGSDASLAYATESDALLEEFRDIEISLFEQLRLPFRLLDMPPAELGAPAYRKYDIEAWLPGRAGYGEISSCSNCTDYQAQRLDIRVAGGDPDEWAHTVNGTACAVPRMLMAVVENYQNPDGSVSVPDVLRRYMPQRKALIQRTKALPELKLIKSLKEDWF